jgi:protein-S-isoprenylcysteine O-methyltransferase Ste14
MVLLNQKILGIAILTLLGGLVAIKRLATGSIFDKPQGSLLVKLVNLFNLFFLLVVNPVAGVLLITGKIEVIGVTRIAIGMLRLLPVLEILGATAYVLGFFTMAWALLTLGRSYQLGGSTPRTQDDMIADGPYKVVRHPMYAAALSISLGLACLTQSWVFLAVFFIYLVLVLPLIALEERDLRKAYGERYAAYQQKVKRLVPLVY